MPAVALLATRLRPPQVPVGNQHGQVGNHAKVMFLEDKGKGYKEPVWYQGSHLSIRRESQTLATVEQAVVAAGWRLPLR